MRSKNPLKPVFHGKASAKQLVKSHGLCISKGYSLAQDLCIDCTFYLGSLDVINPT